MISWKHLEVKMFIPGGPGGPKDPLVPLKPFSPGDPRFPFVPSCPGSPMGPGGPGKPTLPGCPSLPVGPGYPVLPYIHLANNQNHILFPLVICFSLISLIGTKLFCFSHPFSFSTWSARTSRGTWTSRWTRRSFCTCISLLPFVTLWTEWSSGS